jgi:hypothetical protein
MESERILPRWAVLNSIGRVVLIVGVIYVLVVGAFYRMLSNGADFGSAAYRTFVGPPLEQLVLLVALALTAFSLFNILRDPPLPLRYGERYIVLVLVALSLSTWFGAANYFIYARNHDAFAIEKDLGDKLRVGQEVQWETQIVAAREAVSGCERVVEALGTEPEAEFRAARVGYLDYQISLHSAPITIDVKLGYDSAEDPLPTAVHRVVARSKEQVPVVIDRFQGLLKRTDTPLGAHLLRDGFASKASLVQVFREESKWQIANWLSPPEGSISRRPVPLTLFLYQSAMDTLGAGQKALTPLSFLAKTIGLLYAFLKLIFFGMVIGTVARQLASKQPREANQ